MFRRSGLSTASSRGRYDHLEDHVIHIGLLAYIMQVLKFGDDSPYSVQATLEWGSMSDFQKAAGSPALQVIMDDVKNFADKPPKLMTGELVGSQ